MVKMCRGVDFTEDALRRILDCIVRVLLHAKSGLDYTCGDVPLYIAQRLKRWRDVVEKLRMARPSEYFKILLEVLCTVI